MTKEQAIDIIKCLAWHTRPDEERIEQAIKALEQQTSNCKIFGHKENCIGGADCENCDYKIQALEQPSDDVMAIHTQGLDEGIRCAMCTNSMRSDRGCDGGCRVDEDMYKKVMETIKNYTFKQPTSDDCVSRAEVRKIAKEMYLEVANMDLDVHTISDCISYTSSKCRQVLEDKLQALPPVTPVHCIAAVRFNKDDLRDICNERIEIECTHGTCKDCRWLTTDEDGNYYCKQTGYFDRLDYYCADYEKRGNGNEVD